MNKHFTLGVMLDFIPELLTVARRNVVIAMICVPRRNLNKFEIFKKNKLVEYMCVPYLSFFFDFL